ncbi:DUF885 family protein [Rhodothalassium salexigens]|uniref:DUF885 family protein n=1 Tax=Rhodothalassium salexigens TaxID=1086 RepID=UPI001911280F|nr:DUF885 family protein [Rhodothalassium salexigens]
MLSLSPWRRHAAMALAALALALPGLTAPAQETAPKTDQATPPPYAPKDMPAYDELVALFEEWRAFETPPWRDGAPDYTAATTARRHDALKAFQARLAALDVSAWPVAAQVDYHLVRAEMNGMEFNIRVLQPWARDPAFYQSVWTYQSDTPAHEGPTHHHLVELWTYDFPLDDAAADKLARALGVIPPLLAQARQNLTGNARDLWLAGTQTLRDQSATLAALAERVGEAPAALAKAVADARAATDAFVVWLEDQADTKTGPSGIGKDHYTWALRNVHLIPMTWDDEVQLLKRELSRAHTTFRLERLRNRDLPPLDAASDPADYAARAEAAVDRYLGYLDSHDVLSVQPYMRPALMAHTGAFVPEERRNFFARAMHHDTTTLYTHFYHWWDLARMDAQPHPSPVRSGPLLYNIWDSRAEGMATAMEEIYLHAGGYDDRPRVREIVWIMLAQRAARGLGSLYAHANDFTMKQAADFHVARTPDGWMRDDLSLLGFEQQLYLRQPGYGTSYVTGKYLIEKLMAERAEQLGAAFSTKRFFAELDAMGVIPVSMLRWQMIGLNDEIRSLLETEPL